MLGLWLGGGWVIRPSSLFDTKEQIEQCERQRRGQCGGQFKYYAQPVSSFRTYINALARVHTASTPEASMVPSSVRQFPLFNVFINTVIERERAHRSFGPIANDDSLILQEKELPFLFNASEMNVPYQQQRFNLLVLGFRSGLRAEVLRRLQANSFKEGTTSDGRRQVTIMVGTMKNLPANLSHVDTALFEQLLVAGDDPTFCPVAAIDRQRALLARATTSSEPGANWLFRTVRFFSDTLGSKPTTNEMFRGTAKWVSSTLNRQMTWKDVARRAAMTRLANCDDISLEDVAKYFGVHRNTIRVYHRMTRETPLRAARILSGLKEEAHTVAREEGRSEVRTNTQSVSLEAVKKSLKRIR